MATASLERTTSTAPTLTTKATISYWCKRANMAAWNNGAVAGGHDSGNTANNNWQVGFIDTDQFYLWNNGVSMNLISTRRARDTSAWYHVVWTLDSTQSTAADRAKLYINGVQETVFSTANYPTQNGNFDMGRNGNAFRVGKYINTSGSDYWFDGCLSHFHFVDGTAYQASTFGSTDATTGEWKINPTPTVNYGNNGVFILKNDNSNLDRSGNGLNFTMGGTVSKTEDNPSNVFAVLDTNNITLNGTSTYACGGTKFKNSSANWGSALSTLMPTSGKWYFESQVTDNNGQKFMMGICDMDKYPDWRWTSYPYFGYRGYSYYGDGKYLGTNSSGTANSDLDTSLTQTNNNDYIGMAVDLDNNKLYTHINGTYVTYGGGTQNPNTAAYPLNISYGSSGGTVAFGISTRDNYNMYVNFGNGSFNGVALTGTTYQDSNSQGIFKYQPPTDFLALCTKNLNE